MQTQILSVVLHHYSFYEFKTCKSLNCAGQHDQMKGVRPLEEKGHSRKSHLQNQKSD